MNFLSGLIQEVCKLLGVKKVNMSGYYPQTDGLVEKFNSTLISKVAKSCQVQDRDWDQQLLYLILAYHVSAQESTRDSPFFLLYGQDARVPTETVLSHHHNPYLIDLHEYMQGGSSQQHGNCLPVKTSKELKFIRRNLMTRRHSK